MLKKISKVIVALALKVFLTIIANSPLLIGTAAQALPSIDPTFTAATQTFVKNTPTGSEILVPPLQATWCEGQCNEILKLIGPFPETVNLPTSIHMPEGAHTLSLLSVIAKDETILNYLPGIDFYKELFSSVTTNFTTTEINVKPYFIPSYMFGAVGTYFTWNISDTVTRYDIYRASQSSPTTFVKIGESKSQSFVDSSAQSNCMNLYTIGALINGEWRYSSVISVNNNGSWAPWKTNYTPKICSAPVTKAALDFDYTYHVNVTDPNDTIQGHETYNNGVHPTYELTTAPAGMTIDSTGRIHWLPETEGSFPVTVTVTDPGGLTDSQSFTITVGNTNPPPEVTIKIIIENGQPILEWHSKYATTCTLDHAIGQVSPYGYMWVQTDTQTTYTITATGPGGTTAATATLNPLPTLTLSASPLFVFPGLPVTLTWTSGIADSLTLSPGIGTVTLNGSMTVYPQETTTYILQGTGPGGTAHVNVSVVLMPLVAPTVELTATPDSIHFGDSSTLSWNAANADTCTIEPGIGTVATSGSVTVTPDTTTTYTITATGPGGTVTSVKTVTIIAPKANLSVTPGVIGSGDSATLSWSTSDATSCFIEPGIGQVGPNGSITVHPAQNTTYTLTASNPGAGSVTAQTTLTINNGAPSVFEFKVSKPQVSHGETMTLSWNVLFAEKVYISNGIGQVPATGSIDITPDYTTTWTMTAWSSKGTTNADTCVKVLGHTPALLSEGSFGHLYQSLVPADASLASYDEKRFVVLTGLVNDINGNPLQGVQVVVLDHPEYGTASTDTTGRFSLPVNGGGLIKLVYTKDGFISSQRQKDTPWNNVVVFDTITMLQEDTSLTTIVFNGDPGTVMTHRSSEIIDPEFGNRACTMVFTGDNMAYEVDKNGNRVKLLPAITTRATEFTTKESMPATLPPTSPYTYSAELNVDGADHVEFDKPVVVYVENFLNIPVGVKIPMGYYDRNKGVWVNTQDTGVVVQLLDTQGKGVVDALDSNGDGLPTDLEGTGNYKDSVIGLDDPTIYKPGATYWRVTVNHFTGWDWGYTDLEPHYSIGYFMPSCSGNNPCSSYPIYWIPSSGPPSPNDDKWVAWCYWATFTDNAIQPNPEGPPRSDSNDKSCFLAGTLVQTSYGERPIEEIAIGDYVWSYDESTGDIGLNKVTRTFMTPDQNVIDITFDDESGNIDTIEVTPEHPFWVINRGWTPADELKSDDQIYSFKKGALNVKKHHLVGGKQTVYNIEVDRFHNYFVGKRGLLVHNTCINNIDPKKRVLHEDIPVAGTEMTLHYESDRAEGYKQKITVPASGDSVPKSLKYIFVEVDVCGRTFTKILSALPHQIAEFIWDGKDYLGNIVDGKTNADISICFVYNCYYGKSSGLNSLLISTNSTYIPARSEKKYWSYYSLPIFIDKTPFQTENEVALGWSFSNQNKIKKTDLSTLYKGDGTSSQYGSGRIIETVAGTGDDSYNGDGIPADKANIQPSNIIMDKIGNIFIGEGARIRKIDTNGIISTVAGNGLPYYIMNNNGDGKLATEVSVAPWAIALDADDNLYELDGAFHCVRRIDKNGIITTIAGVALPGGWGFHGDGGPATKASFNYPQGLSIDSFGNLYIADTHNNRIRMVDTNGIISTIAGNGFYYGDSGDGGPAIKAVIDHPCQMTFDSKGNLYVVGSGRIRKIDTSGIITTVAGNGQGGFSGDGGSALDAGITPVGITFDSYDNLYIAGGNRIRMVNNAGIIITVAGTGDYGAYNGNGGLAVKANFCPYFMSINKAGDIYTTDNASRRICIVSPIKAYNHYLNTGDICFSDSDGYGYIMSASGLNKQTIDMNTGKFINGFGYNDHNKLISITDKFSKKIIIERNGNGTPTAVISSYGLKTILDIDESSKTLNHVTYPDGSFYEFGYSNDGLMMYKTDPQQHRYDHTYDYTGRLTDVYDQAGGHWNYMKNTDNSGIETSLISSAEGDWTKFVDQIDSTGAYVSTTTKASKGIFTYKQTVDGLNINETDPCGLTTTIINDLDPEYKTDFVKQITITTPGGLSMVEFTGKIYADTNNDGVKDLITETSTVNGKTTTLVQNILLSAKSITTPENRVIASAYDPVTLQITKISVPGLADTTYEYYPSGHMHYGKLHYARSGSRTAEYTYYDNGNLHTLSDPEGSVTTYSGYDALGRLTQITRPDGSTVGFSYDKNGNMTALVTPAGKTNTFVFNKVDAGSTYTTPLGRNYSYVYDKDHRLTTKHFPSGKEIVYNYDDGTGNKSLLRHVVTPENTIDYKYSCGSKVGSMTMGSESVSWNYDGPLVMSETSSGSLNQTLTYMYFSDGDFDVDGIIYAGFTESYTRDKDGLLTGSGPYTIARNPENGLPTSVTGGDLTLSRNFNTYGEADSENYTVNGTSIGSWQVTLRDNVGRILQKKETINGVTDTYEYYYTGTGQLETVLKNGVLVEEYHRNHLITGISDTRMDSLRGIANETITYDDEDRILSTSTASYVFDDDGFLTKKYVGVTQTLYNYSSRGELLSVAFPNGAQVEYIHDPLGRRIAKKVNGTVTEKYLWQGLTRLLAVFDGSDNLLMRFQYADGRMPVSMTKNGSTYYLFYDQVGSLKAVADASGNIVKSVVYDSYGYAVSDSNTAFTVPFGFAGGLFDRHTGLVRFGYRDYDPEIGGWTAKDPILFKGGDTDLYGYVLNDPVNLVDPWGLVDLNLINQNDDPILLQAMNSYKAPDGQYSVGGHGGFDQNGNPLIADSRNSLDHPTRLNPKQLADLIRSQKNYKKGQPIYLASCHAGESKNGHKSFAQQLADEMKVDVWGPTGWIESSNVYNKDLSLKRWDGAPFKMFKP